MTMVERAQKPEPSRRLRLTTAARVLAAHLLAMLPGDPGSVTPAMVALALVARVLMLATGPERTTGRAGLLLPVATAVVAVAAAALAWSAQGPTMVVLGAVVNALRLAPGITEAVARRRARPSSDLTAGSGRSRAS